ncbi:MAG TPA: DUF1206 domain-containing protein [Anaerolineales bacterium]
MEILTRIGYGTRGMIYVIMGILAVDVALGRGGVLASPQGAIAAIGKQPAGLILLWVVLVGLISYALWGVVRAVYDPLDKGHDMKGVLARFGFLTSAFGYAILVWPTYGYITGASRTANGSATQKFITSIMAMPWGRWAIGIVGLAVLAGGLYQIYLGFKAGFDRQFHTYALTSEEAKVITDVGRFGTAARGVVFSFVGGLIILAAYQANPRQPIGMDTALATLMHQPYGIWLLGIVAAGLIAFGFYSMLGALWFRLKKQASG